MFNSRRKEKETYGIVGLGRFGYALACELGESGADLLVIDWDEEKIRSIRDYTDNAFVIKKLDKKSLEETGIQECDVVVVCIGEQMETSILTTLHLTSLGVPTVIAKANTPEHGEILTKLGAEVIYPEHDMAIRLAHRLETARMLDFIQLSEKLNISKLMAPASLVGKNVMEVNLRKNFGLNIIAIESRGQLIEIVDPLYEFKSGDILYLIGSKKSMERLSDL